MLIALSKPEFQKTQNSILLILRMSVSQPPEPGHTHPGVFKEANNEIATTTRNISPLFWKKYYIPCKKERQIKDMLKYKCQCLLQINAQ